MVYQDSDITSDITVHMNIYVQKGCVQYKTDSEIIQLAAILVVILNFYCNVFFF